MDSFNENQKSAFDAMKNGENVFITGPGGSGKSHVINYFVNYFKNNLETKDEKIHVTSSTGLSSLLINGITINQYAGIGIFDKENDYYIKRINRNKAIKERWLKTKTLIIDEISMISADFFEKLDFLAQKIIKNKMPFGGIQIILSGDFLQLPPVKSTNFCFESFSWDVTIKKTFYFNEIIRQKELSFQNVLNKIRIGIVDDEVRNTIDTCYQRKLENKDGIIPTLLFSKKDMVKKYNEEKLNDLIHKNNEKHLYESKYVFSKKIKDESKTGYIELINSQYSNIDDKILMTKYSQVMLNVNMPEENLANGSRGVIIGFSFNEYKNPIVQFLNGKILEIKLYDYKIEENNESVIKRQIPLIHAWAITIHKAQGMSLEYIQTDIGQSIFEYGQAYVVLSRIRSLEGLSLINIDYSKIKAHPKIIEFYNNLI
jgi:ATP-dependent DNA helicase PIF1